MASIGSAKGVMDMCAGSKRCDFMDARYHRRDDFTLRIGRLLELNNHAMCLSTVCICIIAPVGSETIYLRCLPPPERYLTMSKYQEENQTARETPFKLCM